MELMGENLVEDMTIGQQYIMRSLMLRFWNQVFKTGRGTRVLSESLDQIDWTINLENIQALLLTLDECLKVASEKRSQNEKVPEKEFTVEILDKASFLGDAVKGLVKSSRYDLFYNAKLCYPIEFFKGLDWHDLAHRDSYDVNLVTFLGFVDEFQFYDFAPKPIEQGLKVSQFFVL